MKMRPDPSRRHHLETHRKNSGIHTHTTGIKGTPSIVFSLKCGNITIAGIEDERIYASLISVHTIKTRRSWSAANLSPRALVKIEEEGKKRVKGNMQSKEKDIAGKKENQTQAGAGAGATPLPQASNPLAMPQIPSCLPHCKSRSASNSSPFM